MIFIITKKEDNVHYYIYIYINTQWSQLALEICNTSTATRT